jgi:hypothetical protein
MSSAPQASAVQHASFRLYLGAIVLGTLGIQIQGVAVAWQVFRLTRADTENAALALGAIGLAEVIPFVAAVLFAGHVADTHDRRRIARLALAAMTLLGLILFAQSLLRLEAWLQLTLLYAMVTLGGLARSFLTTARQAMIAELLPRGRKVSPRLEQAAQRSLGRRRLPFAQVQRAEKDDRGRVSRVDADRGLQADDRLIQLPLADVGPRQVKMSHRVVRKQGQQALELHDGSVPVLALQLDLPGEQNRLAPEGFGGDRLVRQFQSYGRKRPVHLGSGIGVVGRIAVPQQIPDVASRRR